MAALLQLVQIIFYLFGIQISGQALKVQGHGGNVTTVVVKGAGTSSQNGDVALEAMKQCFKSANFTAGTIEVLVIPYFFLRFFFVAINYRFCLKAKCIAYQELQP